LRCIALVSIFTTGERRVLHGSGPFCPSRFVSRFAATGVTLETGLWPRRYALGCVFTDGKCARACASSTRDVAGRWTKKRRPKAPRKTNHSWTTVAHLL
jgi:hypothetical protein